MKYACFDIGNVLYHVEFDPLLTKLSKDFNITKSEAFHFLGNNQKRCDLGISLIEEEFAHRFAIKSDVLLAELVAIWMDCIKPNSAMLDLVADLQNEDVKIALLSNMGHEHLSRLSASHPFASTIQFFSCLVGARKPTMVYYSTFLHLHPEFIGAPYIDDLQENLDAGTDFGFKSIRFALDENPTKDDITALKEKILK